MKNILKVIAVIIILAAGGYAAIMYFTSNARTLAKNFVTYSSSGQYEAAYALMHPALQNEFSMNDFNAFNNSQPYDDISFSTVKMANGATILMGVATTATDCASQISFKIIGKKIVLFNIQPLCPKP